MQEFSLSAFVDRIRYEMYNNFPNLEGRGFNPSGSPKHGGIFVQGFNREIRDVAFKDNPVIVGENTISFDIGNRYAETHYPYYHILQDAPVIHKRPKKGEPKSDRGSQSKVKNLGQRDYGRVSFNGKTYSKEYAKNVRGKRYSVVERATRYDKEGNVVGGNASSVNYYNEHYQYINRILEDAIKKVAPEFGYRLVQVKGTSLKDDYDMQEEVELDSMLEDMINSYRYDDYDGEEDYE